MDIATIRRFPQAFAGVLLAVLTSSYSGAYAYHTLHPIEKIRSHQQYEGQLLRYDLIDALAHFCHLKSEELSFVSKAVTWGLR